MNKNLISLETLELSDIKKMINWKIIEAGPFSKIKLGELQDFIWEEIKGGILSGNEHNGSIRTS